MNEVPCEVEAMDALLAKARARMPEASSPQERLHPCELDWMTPEELAQLHELQLQYRKIAGSRDDARRRVAAKRAARRAAQEPVFGVPEWAGSERVRIDTLSRGDTFMCCQGHFWKVLRFHNGCARVSRVGGHDAGLETWFAGCAEVVREGDRGQRSGA